MTREEAINVMQKYTDTDSGISKVVAEAHEMAISALEQEPCDDAISRKAIIRYLQDEYHGMISDESMKIYKIIELLDNQPSVQPKPTECEDAISREAVIEWLKDKDIIKLKSQEENARKELRSLPSVTQKSVIEDIKAELISLWGNEPCSNECGCLDEVLEIIDKHIGKEQE